MGTGEMWRTATVEEDFSHTAHDCRLELKFDQLYPVEPVR